MGDLGQRLRRCRRAGDGERAIGCRPSEQMKAGGWARGVVEIDVERGAPTTLVGYLGTTACLASLVSDEEDSSPLRRPRLRDHDGWSC